MSIYKHIPPNKKTVDVFRSFILDASETDDAVDFWLEMCLAHNKITQTMLRNMILYCEWRTEDVCTEDELFRIKYLMQPILAAELKHFMQSKSSYHIDDMFSRKHLASSR